MPQLAEYSDVRVYKICTSSDNFVCSKLVQSMFNAVQNYVQNIWTKLSIFCKNKQQLSLLNHPLFKEFLVLLKKFSTMMFKTENF